MRTYDLTPLFRSSIGFDRFSDLFDTALAAADKAPSYPPYNIEKRSEDNYRLVMAVAGFGEADLDITVQNNQLIVSGRMAEPAKESEFLHRGIATRAFERTFSLADHVKVTDAKLANGLLELELVREVPEAQKPRKIAVKAVSDGSKKAIEGKKAA